MQQQDNNTLAVIDIGTSKIVCLVGKKQKNSNKLEILGSGTVRSHGLKSGVVVNIDATVSSIKEAVRRASISSNIEIKYVYAGVAGSHIRSFNSHGIVAIQNKEVTEYDINRVIDAARAIAIPANLHLLHIIPQQYIIDEQDDIREPLGMSGVRLEAKVHMVAGSASAVQNILKCVQKCGLKIIDVVLEQLGSSQCVLSSDEKDLGVCLVDIGGGTTDIAIFSGNSINHTINIPIAGDQVNNDIAMALKISTKKAEELKVEKGKALSSLIDSSEHFTIKSVNEEEEYEVPLSLLTEIIEARYEELFHIVKQEISKHTNNRGLTAGVVITGGGSKIPGLSKLAQQVLDTTVRLGGPRNIIASEKILNNPMYSTAVGLLQDSEAKRKEPIFSRILNWIKDNF
jgi:cell division protein FtsA